MPSASHHAAKRSASVPRRRKASSTKKKASYRRAVSARKSKRPSSKRNSSAKKTPKGNPKKRKRSASAKRGSQGKKPAGGPFAKAKKAPASARKPSSAKRQKKNAHHTPKAKQPSSALNICSPFAYTNPSPAANRVPGSAVKPTPGKRKRIRGAKLFKYTKDKPKADPLEESSYLVTGRPPLAGGSGSKAKKGAKKAVPAKKEEKEDKMEKSVFEMDEESGSYETSVTVSSPDSKVIAEAMRSFCNKSSQNTFKKVKPHHSLQYSFHETAQENKAKPTKQEIQSSKYSHNVSGMLRVGASAKKPARGDGEEEDGGDDPRSSPLPKNRMVFQDPDGELQAKTPHTVRKKLKKSSLRTHTPGGGPGLLCPAHLLV